MTESRLSTFINEFRGGNRAHRYEISGSIGGNNDLNKFFVRAVSLPPSQIIEDFTKDWIIKQVDENEDTMKEINLIGCWPNLIGPIDMDANAVDTLVEFNVVVNYQYYEVTK